MTTDLKYPVGKYIAQPFSEKLLGEWLTDIKNLPQHLENAILNLDEAQLVQFTGQQEGLDETDAPVNANGLAGLRLQFGNCSRHVMANQR